MRLLVLGLACALGAAGCGGSPKGEKLASLTGTVTRGGKPVPNLGLCFVPDAGPRGFATTDADGKYKVVGVSGEPGAALGRHKVWVRLPPADKGDDKPAKSKGADPEVAAILKKYGNADTTPLTVTVTGDQSIDLPLD